MPKALNVSLCLPKKPVVPIGWAEMERDALVLGYKVRNRRRWASDEEQVGDEVARFTKAATIDALKRIGEARRVEVSIPWRDVDGDERGSAGRLMPWEFLISTATREYRDGPLTVVRRLVTKGSRKTSNPLLRRTLLVESAPGRLAQLYSLAQETRLVRASLGLEEDDKTVTEINCPDLPELRASVKKFRPGLIHVAGFDNHQASDLLRRSDGRSKENGEARERSVLDGVALAGDTRPPVDYVPAAKFAGAVTAGNPPTLVSLNLFNSAARIAPDVIMSGAAHAIGFQDAIDDRVAEQFFATLYRRLAMHRTLLDAFQDALDMIRETPKRLLGACVVLWSAESLIGPPRVASSRARSGVASSRPPAAKVLPLENDVTPNKRVQVLCEPRKEMNYSLLHNGGSPFTRLLISRGQVTGPITDLNVSVTMFVGEESFPFVRQLSIPADQDSADLTRAIKVPLTSSLIRKQSETMRSVLAVEVRVADEVVHRDTYAIALSPVDQWCDTEQDRIWLSSFVLPRDPAVARLVQSARHYLVAIEDAPKAGFDGYQSVDLTAVLDKRYQKVDDQVRAIWHALLLDKRLLYINPPPSHADPGGGYKEAVQRLRTPTEVLDGGHGTCVDLALLVCACLEYVDIWPVIFLFDDHAFPGYWRSDKLHDDDLQDFVRLDDLGTEDLSGSTAAGHAGNSWELVGFAEVKELVKRGDIVPLESVGLTDNSSFTEAIENAKKTLHERSSREFESLIDLRRARLEGLSPLPLL